MHSIRIASTQFDFCALKKPNDFWDRCEDLTAKAARQDAKVIVFPEYFVMPWLLAQENQKWPQALEGFFDHGEEFHKEMKALAQGLHLMIVAGSVPIRQQQDLLSRSFVYFPDGRRVQQDKKHLTRSEREDWGILSGANSATIFDYEGARWSIIVGNDIEFAASVQDSLREDADFILVPSSAEDSHGSWRIRHCAQARAVETQCGVIVSAAVGGDPSHVELQKRYGQAGFFTPCDLSMPEGGVLGLGELNKENVHIAEYDLVSLHRLRIEGTLLNRKEHLRHSALDLR